MGLTLADARAELIDLTDASAAEVKAIFNAMTDATAEAIRDRLMDELGPLGDEYQLAAASLAADWYDNLREAKAVKGYFLAITPGLATPTRWKKLAGFGVGPLFRANPDPDAAMSLIEGGLQRTIANAHRDTIALSAVNDPQARGWGRFGIGLNCDFCNMLIDRGAVYSDSTAEFEAHDHCNCIAGPFFE